MATLALISRPEIADAIVQKVREGVPAATAARLAGIQPQQFGQWKQIAEGATIWPNNSAGRVTEQTRSQIVNLFERLSHAEADFAAEMVQIITQAARSVNPKTGIPEWRASDCLLSKHPTTRKDWYEHREVSMEHRGDVQVAVAHRLAASMLPEALLATPAVDMLEGQFSTLPDLPESEPTPPTNA